MTYTTKLIQRRGTYVVHFSENGNRCYLSLGIKIEQETKDSEILQFRKNKIDEAIEKCYKELGVFDIKYVKKFYSFILKTEPKNRLNRSSKIALRTKTLRIIFTHKSDKIVLSTGIYANIEQIDSNTGLLKDDVENSQFLNDALLKMKSIVDFEILKYYKKNHKINTSEINEILKKLNLKKADLNKILDESEDNKKIYLRYVADKRNASSKFDYLKFEFLYQNKFLSEQEFEFLKNSKVDRDFFNFISEHIIREDNTNIRNSYSKTLIESYENAKKINIKYCDFFNITVCAKITLMHKRILRKLGVPHSPAIFYKDTGWISETDWMGRSKIYLSYEEAVKVSSFFCAKEDIKNKIQYIEKYKKDNVLRKLGLPPNPPISYKNSGWVGWDFWLGLDITNVTRISNVILRRTIKQLLDNDLLLNLDQITLIGLLKQHNIYDRLNLKNLVKSPLGSRNRKNEIKKLKQHLELEEMNDVTDDREFFESDQNISANQAITNLKNLELGFSKTLDAQKIENIISYNYKKLWNDYLTNSEVLNIILENKNSKFKYLKIVIDSFLKDLNKCQNFDLVDYKYPNHPISGKQIIPTLMQKLTAIKVIENKYFLNLSTTGAGKMLSGLLSVVHSNSKNILIITNNATVEKWKSEINFFHENNVVHERFKNCEPVENTRNYFVENYEFFSNHSVTYLIEFIEKYNFDFVLLDEIQFTKRHNDSNSSNRSRNIEALLGKMRETNPNLIVLGMTATPIINRIGEIKYLVELISGKKYEDVDTYPTIFNSINWHHILNEMSLRERYKCDMPLNIFTSDNDQRLKILGNIELAKEIKNVEHFSKVDILQTGLKIQQIIKHNVLKKGTIIYTHFVEDIIKEIHQNLSNTDFSYGYFTGDEKSGMNKFLNSEIDILIASKPIGVGFDGLQKVCNNIVIMTIPFTHSDYEQLIGRIHRQQSSFTEINVYVPQILFEYNNDSYSWDVYRWNVMQNKKTFSDLVVDGIMPNTETLPTQEEMLKQAKESLQKILSKIENDQLEILDREKKEVKKPIIPKKRGNNYTKFNDITNELYSMSSTELHNQILTNVNKAQEFIQYNKSRQKFTEKWIENPVENIAKRIKDESLIIADLGCGENLIKRFLPNIVHSYDHIVTENTKNVVIQSDFSKLNLKEESIDVAVYSLSILCGTNYKDYISELKRFLKPNGKVFIAEPLTSNTTDLLEILNNNGFTLTNTYERYKFKYFELEKNILKNVIALEKSAIFA